MIFRILIFIVPLAVCILVSIFSPAHDDTDWEEVNRSIREFNETVYRDSKPRDPHDNATYRYLHRRDDEHERHRRNQWPL